MSTDFNETPGAPRYRRPGGGSLAQMWQNPIFKLVVVVIVLAGGSLAGVKMLSGRSGPRETVIPAPVRTGQEGSGQEEVTQDYALAVQKGDEARAAAARATGESSVPTPLQVGVANPETASDLSGQEGQDPLKEFEAILRNGPPGNAKPDTPAVPAGQAQVPPEVMQNLTQGMTQQISLLMRTWTPDGMQTVASTVDEATVLRRTSAQPTGSMPRTAGGIETKPIVAAGSVYYGQMLIEANSDVPGPVMAQILTGPLAGGKAIGHFETFRNHLVITFDTVAFRSKQMDVNILALDPNTTLGGVATEVDPRYFQRVLLPAAAAFVSAYGETLSRPSSTVSVTGTGATNVTTSTDKQGSKDAVYAGIDATAGKIEQFLDEEAAATKRLVRVAVGTPIGLFFTKPVCTMNGQCEIREGEDGSAVVASPAAASSRTR